MPDRPVTPFIIGIVVGVFGVATGVFYATVFAYVPGGAIARSIIAVGVALFVAALSVTVLRRIREIRKEDPDDYRNY